MILISSSTGLKTCHHCPSRGVTHGDVIKWKHFPRYRPFVRGIHLSLVNSPLKGQWRGALMFYLFFIWINGWVNDREAGDWRRHRAHYAVTVMPCHWAISGYSKDSWTMFDVILIVSSTFCGFYCVSIDQRTLIKMANVISLKSHDNSRIFFSDTNAPWVNSVLLYVRPEVFHDVSLEYDRCSSGICLMYDICSSGICLMYEPLRT